MRAAPGDEYKYNSGITVLISHILWEATGKHADEYAEEHLFGPLGIDTFYWKKTPTRSNSAFALRQHTIGVILFSQQRANPG